jgi:hypothetical protein
MESTMTYRFLRDHRGQKSGDPVPAGWDWGIVSALIQRGIVEEVSEPEIVTAAIDAPECDKSMSSSPARGKVRRK